MSPLTLGTVAEADEVELNNIFEDLHDIISQSLNGSPQNALTSGASDVLGDLNLNLDSPPLYSPQMEEGSCTGDGWGPLCSSLSPHPSALPGINTGNDAVTEVVQYYGQALDESGHQQQSQEEQPQQGQASSHEEQGKCSRACSIDSLNTEEMNEILDRGFPPYEEDTCLTLFNGEKDSVIKM